MNYISPFGKPANITNPFSGIFTGKTHNTNTYPSNNNDLNSIPISIRGTVGVNKLVTYEIIENDKGLNDNPIDVKRKILCIVAHNNYSNFTIEELRAIDYRNRKNQQAIEYLLEADSKTNFIEVGQNQGSYNSYNSNSYHNHINTGIGSGTGTEVSNFNPIISSNSLINNPFGQINNNTYSTNYNPFGKPNQISTGTGPNMINNPYGNLNNINSTNSISNNNNHNSIINYSSNYSNYPPTTSPINSVNYSNPFIQSNSTNYLTSQTHINQQQNQSNPLTYNQQNNNIVNPSQPLQHYSYPTTLNQNSSQLTPSFLQSYQNNSSSYLNSNSIYKPILFQPPQTNISFTETKYNPIQNSSINQYNNLLELGNILERDRLLKQTKEDPLGFKSMLLKSQFELETKPDLSNQIYDDRLSSTKSIILNTPFNFPSSTKTNLDNCREVSNQLYYKPQKNFKQDTFYNSYHKSTSSFHLSKQQNYIIIDNKSSYNLRNQNTIATDQSGLSVKSKNSNNSNNSGQSKISNSAKDINITNFNDKVTTLEIDNEHFPLKVKYFYMDYCNEINKGLIKLQLMNFNNPDYNQCVIDIISNIKANGKSLKQNVVYYLIKYQIISENEKIDYDQIIITTKQGFISDNDILIENQYAFYTVSEVDLNKNKLVSGNILSFWINDKRYKINREDLLIKQLEQKLEGSVIEDATEESVSNYEVHEIHDSQDRKSHNTNNKSFYSQSESHYSENLLDDYFPQCNNDLFTSPCLDVLIRMSKKELQEVNNFIVYNSYGRIEFLCPVDLTYLNINNIIVIKQCYFSVYKSEHVPEAYEKLNVPFQVSLYNVCPPLDDPSEEEIIEFGRQVGNEIEFWGGKNIEYRVGDNYTFVFVMDPIIN